MKVDNVKIQRKRPSARAKRDCEEDADKRATAHSVEVTIQTPIQPPVCT